jgi:hypothetical protein
MAREILAEVEEDTPAPNRNPPEVEEEELAPAADAAE